MFDDVVGAGSPALVEDAVLDDKVVEAGSEVLEGSVVVGPVSDPVLGCSVPGPDGADVLFEDV